ncbi:ATPase [Pseudorhodoferax aquiterrae]|uniref:ATPase n=1 Tax=Pseudorhodoferax aquiterrae TaxID=747304 RepID=A0ABQ3FVC0_9BURK|nr:ATP-binding protein [Pseudorhodoferax aquiterrae]GHC70212.1 ATPase [Pseudorhodoferax aquiterrae]
MSSVSRQIAAALLQHLEEFPAVAILGPRQVGKTTLALDLVQQQMRDAAPLYLDLESPADLARLSDPEAFFAANADRLLVLDEVQRVPGLFMVLRGCIDRLRRAGAPAGRFLLLGSASIDLLAQSSESLAGRLAYVELAPFIVTELSLDEAATPGSLWLRGGFPQSYLARSDAASLRWRQQFITTYLERDIPQLGPRIPAQALRRLWTMLAYEQAQMLNAARLAASMAVSGQTIARYLDLLCDLLLVRRLQPWARQSSKRLVKAPKVYVRDSGLVHALLGLETADALLSHPVVGGSWEGWIIENLLACVPAGTEASYYRTAVGAEIDLVLELPGGGLWALEIKRSSAPSVSKGFHIACDDIQPTRRLVVSSANARFPMAGVIEHLPLLDLMQELRAA